jgi:hypothetical protein
VPVPDKLTPNPLDALRIKVGRSLDLALRDALWGKPQLMSRALREVSSLFDRPCEPGSRRSLESALAALRSTRTLRSFLDLKYACLGITHPVGPDAWLLIEDPALFPLLLDQVDSRYGPAPGREDSPAPGRGSRRFLKCYQALLSGYFAYNVYRPDSTPRGRNNWALLRAFLRDRLTPALKMTPAPSWLKILDSNRGLLGEDISELYGQSLGQGSYHDLKSACEGLLIPRDSWVWEVTVLMRVRSLCSLDDGAFLEHVDQCLALVGRSTGSALSEVMKKQCVALLAARYAACSSNPEHAGLLEAAVALIGNPWANRAAWDAFVKDEPARAMVGSWLKRRLIRDFFGFLSEGDPRDGRRLSSWLSMEHRIDDLWIALGPHAFSHDGARHRELKSMAADRILELEHGEGPKTCALIMRIDDHVFVELSTPGHSCMVFKSSSLPFDLDRKWVYVGSRNPDQQQPLLQGQVLTLNVISVT